MSEMLPVYLYGHRVGDLRRESSSDVTFMSDPTAITHFSFGSPILSEALPLDPRPSKKEPATAFFGGLLPEGRGLINLSKQAGCRPDDVYRLIEFAGMDVAGAVSVGADPAAASTYQQLDEHEVEQRLLRIDDYALGAMGGGGSLSGHQPKTTLAWRDNSWAAGIGGAPSTHILKPVATESEPALRSEAYSLALARAVELTSCRSSLQRFGQRLVLVIERYDRVIGEDGSVRRVHQEDAAQALGLPWRSDAKFEGQDSRASLRSVAGLLRRRKSVFGRGVDDRERLLACTTFNLAVGNTDAHAKNFSMLHFENGSIELAPLYDISSHALGYEGNRNMAMRIAGQSYQPDITRQHLVDEAVAWQLKGDIAVGVINDTLEQLRYAVEDTDPGAAPSMVSAYVASQAQSLLDGKSAGAAIKGHPLLDGVKAPAPMPPRQA